MELKFVYQRKEGSFELDRKGVYDVSSCLGVAAVPVNIGL